MDNPDYVRPSEKLQFIIQESAEALVFARHAAAQKEKDTSQQLSQLKDSIKTLKNQIEAKDDEMKMLEIERKQLQELTVGNDKIKMLEMERNQLQDLQLEKSQM